MKFISYLILMLSISLFAESESDYYVIEKIPLPEGEVVEVGSIALMPNKKIAVSSRRGDIFIGEGTFGDLSQIKWKTYARGLHEPFGMYYKDGSMFLTQRPEFSKLTDTNGDLKADRFETINDEWGINGDYHEYAFGTKPDKDGNVWIVLCLTGSGGASSEFRGWCVRITPEGKMIPTTSGIRSPGGIGFNHEGEVFYTDNQGLWNGTSHLKHLVPGKFVGNPTGNKFYALAPNMGKQPVAPIAPESLIQSERSRISELIPPTIMFPHAKVANSPTAIVTDHTKGKFGPYANQLFVADQTTSKIMRVDLEKVNGIYQGAVFYFVSGFGSGIVPMELADDGTMFVGGTNRGWGSTGREPFALERLRWTGKIPFEVHSMKVTKKGFRLTFTQPVDAVSAENLENYKMKSWTYKYQKGYGSPEINHQDQLIQAANLQKDGRTVELIIDNRQLGHVHELTLGEIKSGAQKALLHNMAYYTLNEIPN
jgi:glucose/arabinose dehydrogenase